MTNLCRFLRASLPLFALTLAATGQNYTAKTIVFSQRGDFTQQQLEDSVGLHAGSTFTADQLGAAAQKLVDTGYFDGAGATVDGKITACTVLFDIKPIDKSHMLPVGFENFVWLTRDEIRLAIAAKFPLYTGYLPDNSPHQDEIKSALTQALAAKSIVATVGYETYEPTLRHPRREVAFRVTNPSIRVTNIKLGGVTPALVPLVQKSVNATARTRFTEGPADVTTAEGILTPLLDAGYLEATLSDVSPTPTAAASGDVGVVLSAKLQAGEIYQVSGISFAGTPILASQEFVAAAKLHAGDVASHAMLLETLRPIDAAYRRKGYMDVVVEAKPSVDEAAHTVGYEVTVQPGKQYRIHEVTPNNLDAAARADFDRGFLMKTGELYNPEYVTSFLKSNTALRALVGYSAGFKAYAMPDSHTVDLVITFVKAGR
jgi:outer membrane protein assembly factor BamA